jgi:hypothetical protein
LAGTPLGHGVGWLRVRDADAEVCARDAVSL